MRSFAAETPLREPPPLAPGSRVALIAPSGTLNGPQDIERACSNVASFGWEPVVAPHALERDGYFAGTDQLRAADLSAAIADVSIDAIWCLRGGYGAMRLLDRVDFSPLAARPKALIGYSDVTALHSAWHLMDVISYHGPVARGALTELATISLTRAAIYQDDSCGRANDATIIRSGKASGRLAGGNLTLVASLCGTPWAINFHGTIAILEDVNEASYRLDRMLTQLRIAGAFDGCKGIVFGHFTDCAETSDSGTRSVRDVLAETATLLNVPAIYGVPLGHIPDQWTFPLGANATLDADALELRVNRSPAASAAIAQASSTPTSPTPQ